MFFSTLSVLLGWVLTEHYKGALQARVKNWVTHAPCALPADCLAMAVSVLLALTVMEEPDFFTEAVLPVCWVLVPFLKALLHRASHLIYKDIMGSWEERPQEKLGHSSFIYLGQQAWEVRDGEPAFSLQNG